MPANTLTHRIRVETHSFFVPNRSDPANHHFFYAYRIRITNEGAKGATLLGRHWIITDGLGNVEEVRGAGVVGEQPHLEPGEQFEYTSACPLPTQFGVMRGFYHMVDDDGEPFEVDIAPFKLYIPALNN